MNNQHYEILMEKQAVIETVNQLFIGTDERNWTQVKSVFASDVLFDMTSMAGGEPATLTSQEIVDSWDEGLKPLDAIHHQVSNFIVEVDLDKNEATAFNYGIATHYLPNATGRNTRTFVGSYDFHLVKVDGNWKIDQFKFNLKYVDGNPNLEADAAAEAPTE